MNPSSQTYSPTHYSQPLDLNPTQNQYIPSQKFTGSSYPEKQTNDFRSPLPNDTKTFETYPNNMSPERNQEIKYGKDFTNSNIYDKLKEPFEYNKQPSNKKEELPERHVNFDSNLRYTTPHYKFEEQKSNPYPSYEEEFRQKYLLPDYTSLENKDLYHPQYPPIYQVNQDLAPKELYHPQSPNREQPQKDYPPKDFYSPSQHGLQRDFFSLDKNNLNPNQSTLKPDIQPQEKKSPSNPFNFPSGYHLSPNQSPKAYENPKETSPEKQDFKSQLPHHKEKIQKLKVVPTEEASKKILPRIVESRKQAIDGKTSGFDKGFYNEGLNLSKEPPKKATFNIESKVNPFNSGINIEEIKNTSAFSKHIFEDKTIVDILERQAGGKSRVVNEDDDWGTKDILEPGMKKNLYSEKKGKVIIEKGESHSDPYARLAHIIFKLFSIASYIVLSGSSTSTDVIYQAIIIFSALDFWIVKNVTARLLIGYRYWCEFSTLGKERWIFETYCQRNVKENKNNTRFFWIVQSFFSLLWFIYAVYELISLSIAMTICLLLGFFSCFSNLMIYRRCEQIKKNNMDELFVRMTPLDRTLYLIRGSIKLPLFKDISKFKKGTNF